MKLHEATQFVYKLLNLWLIKVSSFVISLLWVWCRVELEGFNRIWLELVADPFEFIYGGGEQFSYLNLRNAEHNSNIYILYSSNFSFQLFLYQLH